MLYVSIIIVIFFVNKCIFSTSFQRRQFHLKVGDMPLQFVRISLFYISLGSCDVRNFTYLNKQ